MADNSAFHIALFVSSLVCGLALLAWFVLLSAYPGWLRACAAILSIGALVGLPALYRVEKFSGTLIPTLVRRGQPARDAALPEMETAGRADLWSTTPADFPQFLGPNRNGTVDHVRLARDWSTHPPEELWRRDIGAGWSGFVAVNGFALTMEQRGSEELVTCYDIATGEPRWTAGVEALHESMLGFKGPRSTPTIHQGRVYVNGATGIIRCLDGSDGSTLWSRDYLHDLGISQEQAEGPVAWGRATPSGLLAAIRPQCPSRHRAGCSCCRRCV